jgi:predicted transcriptional regulator
MKPDSMDAVFQALAHPDRRRLLDIVKESPGCSVNDVCAYFNTSRIAVMKHLRVLERSELIQSRKKGRTRHLFFNAIPIQLIYDRWTTDYSALWAGHMTKIKHRVESKRKKRSTGKGKRNG